MEHLRSLIHSLCVHCLSELRRQTTIHGFFLFFGNGFSWFVLCSAHISPFIASSYISKIYEKLKSQIHVGINLILIILKGIYKI